MIVFLYQNKRIYIDRDGDISIIGKHFFVAVALSFSDGLRSEQFHILSWEYIEYCWLGFYQTWACSSFHGCIFPKAETKYAFFWYGDDERVNSAFQKVFALLPGPVVSSQRFTQHKEFLWIFTGIISAQTSSNSTNSH